MSPAAASGRAEQLELVAWVAGLGVATASGLALRQGAGEASARARLTALAGKRLLRGHRILHGGPTLYTATRRGIAACGLEGLAPAAVSAAGAAHAQNCCDVAAALERAFPAWRLLGEPALRLEERRRGRPLATIAVGRRGAGAASHRPDLVLLDPSRAGRPLAVEVELTVKAPRRLQAICRGWARSRHVAGVLYVVSPAVLAPLTRAVEATAAGGTVVTVSLEVLLAGAAEDRSLAQAIAAAR